MTSNRIFNKGGRLVCCDCNEPTIFHYGSSLDRPEMDDLPVSPQLIDRLVNDLLDYDECSSLGCRKPFVIKRKEQLVFWVGTTPSRIAGPICRICCNYLLFTGIGHGGLSEDLQIFYVNRSSEETWAVMEFLHKESARRKAVVRAAEGVSVLQIPSELLF